MINGINEFVGWKKDEEGIKTHEGGDWRISQGPDDERTDGRTTDRLFRGRRDAGRSGNDITAGLSINSPLKEERRDLVLSFFLSSVCNNKEATTTATTDDRRPTHRRRRRRRRKE